MKRLGIALINLDRDTDRLAHMTRECGRLGLAFERFPAVLGLAVPDWLRPWFFEGDGAPVATLKPGEIGVYASHISLHRRLLEDESLDWLLVMEDDLELAPDLPALLARLAGSDLAFDVLKLSNPAKAAFLDHGEVVPGRSLVTYARVPNNLGAYLISREGAAKTTAFHGLRRHAIDEDMRRDWDWGLQTYGILPAPVRANIFDRSSIDSLGDRGLGRESVFDKLRRRRIGHPGLWARQLGWQFRQFGVAGWLMAQARFARRSLAKRFGIEGPEAGLRMEGPARIAPEPDRRPAA